MWLSICQVFALLSSQGQKYERVYKRKQMAEQAYSVYMDVVNAAILFKYQILNSFTLNSSVSSWRDENCGNVFWGKDCVGEEVRVIPESCVEEDYFAVLQPKGTTGLIL